MVRRLLFVLLLLLPPTAFGDGRVILVLGDSLSAGFGIETTQSWVTLLEQRLRDEYPAYRVSNASISGETTRGGLARLPRLLEHLQPAVVVIELGGNDGLRGLPIEQMRTNLEGLIQAARRNGAEVLLVGMRLPPNYGMAYTEKFHQVYVKLAEKYELPLVPFFLDGVATDRRLMQYDGVHPRAEAQARLLENVWPHLEPLLQGPQERKARGDGGAAALAGQQH